MHTITLLFNLFADGKLMKRQTTTITTTTVICPDGTVVITETTVTEKTVNGFAVTLC